MITFLLKRTIKALLVLWFAGCGGSGHDQRGSGVPDNQQEDDRLEPVRQVSGTLSLNMAGNPAAGFHIVLANHTTRSIHLAVVDQDGHFSFPLNRFRRRELFSFHVVDGEFRYVGDIRFAGQGVAIQYQGGAGFAMDELLVVGDMFGLYNLSESSLNVPLVPGFQVDVQTPADLRVLPVPEQLTSVTVRSELVVSDELELLQGVYRSQLYPHRRQAFLANNSRIGISIETKGNHPLRGIGVQYAGSWLRGSRFVEDPMQVAQQAVFWETAGFTIPQRGQLGHYAGVYRGMLPEGNESFLLQVMLSSGDELVVGSALGRVVSAPPRLVNLAQGVDAMVPVDYISNGAETGLTIPFCRTSGVLRFGIEPPEASDEAPFSFGSDISGVDMYFTYFGLEGGMLVELDVDPEDFPAGFSEKYQDTNLTLANREWDPEQRSLVWIFKATGPMTPHELPIFEEILLTNLATVTRSVHRIRIDYIYRGQRVQTGARFWLQNC